MTAGRAQEAAEMAEAFLFVRDLFAPPSRDQWSRLTSAQTRAAWTALADRLCLRRGLDLPSTEVDYESAFIAAFDAGAPHPLVPLNETHYDRKEPVPRVLHENVLFYQAFGLRLRSAGNETADHLRHQLEFVAHLYRMEAEERRGRADAEVVAQIESGRRDFLERHLVGWLPEAAERARRAPAGFGWVANFLTAALNLTVLACRETPGADPGTTEALSHGE